MSTRPFPRTLSRKRTPLGVTSSIALALAVLHCRDAPAPPRTPLPAADTAATHVVAGTPPPYARTSARHAAHAYGRVGDLVVATSRALYTFSTAPDGAGKKPLRGALLDADLDAQDDEDPLLWLRPAWVASDGVVHALVAAAREIACPGGARGVEVAGVVDGVSLTASACPSPEGALTTTLRADGLPAGAKLGQELGPGPSPVVLDRGGAAWEGTHPFAALAVEGPRSTLLIEGSGQATRRLVHIAKEVFPSPVALTYEGATASVRLRLVPERPAAALGALALKTVPLALAMSGTPGSATFLDADGTPITRLDVPAEGAELRVPEGFAAEIELRDASGQRCARARQGDPALATATCPKAARLSLAVRLAGPDGAVPAPFHALVYGEHGTPDPELVDLGARGEKLARVAERNNLYSIDGGGELALQPGSYHVLVARGLESTMEERHLTLAPGATERLAFDLRRVLPADVLSADFHLHAAPSPDSSVSLAQRVTTLACEGLAFAVATDHNRITDYSRAVQKLAPTPPALLPALAIGDEITSSGARLWGHFNAFPLPAATLAPEDATIPYFDVAPRELFAGARRAGAAIVQVNHPRMPPRIGYFNQADFDSESGRAGADFAEDFDAVEAHNGIWLESPARVREGLRDLVGLARRGKKVAATGNSDSHKLVLEEPGYPRTFVLLDPKTATTEPLEQRVISAVKQRHTVVSSGAFIDARLDGQLPGDVVTPRGKTMKLHVRVLAPAWVPVETVEIWLDGGVTRSLPVTATGAGVRFEADVTLPVDRDRTVTVWVEAKRPLPRVLHETDARAIAFTTPFYVDADHDGQVRLAPARDAKDAKDANTAEVN